MTVVRHIQTNRGATVHLLLEQNKFSGNLTGIERLPRLGKLSVECLVGDTTPAHTLSFSANNTIFEQDGRHNSNRNRCSTFARLVKIVAKQTFDDAVV